MVIILFIFFGYKMQTMCINLVICFFPLTSLLAIENFQNHFIFNFLFFYFSFGQNCKNSRKANINYTLTNGFWLIFLLAKVVMTYKKI
jgi:hypothetical protein